jgi:hypothetical protein
MSYYILPKYSSNKINICATWSSENNPIISPSLIYYLNNIILLLNNPIFLSNFIKVDKIITPYKYLYSKIPTYNLSICKLSISKICYVYIELINLCNLFESFTDTNITCTYITSYNEEIIDGFSLLRENHKDTYIQCTHDTSILSDFITIELTPFTPLSLFSLFNTYILSLIRSVCYILKNQNIGGMAILKIDHLFYKPVLDILFILNIVYENVYIVKPNVSSIINNELYIVCKNFTSCDDLSTIISKLEFSYNEYIDNKHLSSLLEELPIYFLNKIEEANIIIYHQKIQYIDHICNIIINNHKLDNFKKHNIQKCIQWCEKYKIPHNKITDKLNIFLQPSDTLDEQNEEKEEECEINIELDTLINPDNIDSSTFLKQIELLNIFNYN